MSTLEFDWPEGTRGEAQDLSQRRAARVGVAAQIAIVIAQVRDVSEVALSGCDVIIVIDIYGAELRGEGTVAGSKEAVCRPINADKTAHRLGNTIPMAHRAGRVVSPNKRLRERVRSDQRDRGGSEVQVLDRCARGSERPHHDGFRMNRQEQSLHRNLSCRHGAA